MNLSKMQQDAAQQRSEQASAEADDLLQGEQTLASARLAVLDAVTRAVLARDNDVYCDDDEERILTAGDEYVRRLRNA